MEKRCRKLCVLVWLAGVVWAGLGFGGVAEGAERVRVWEALPPGLEGGVEEVPTLAASGEVLVRFRPEAAARRAVLGRDFGSSVRWLTPGKHRALAPAGRGVLRAADAMAVITLPRGMALKEGLKAVQARGDVLYAEPNQRLGLCVEPPPPLGSPTDFEFVRQWALHNSGQTGGKPGADIGALEAWAVETGSRDIVVAIIDTGVDYYHPDLEANIWRNAKEIPANGIDDDGNGYIDDLHGYDFVSDDGDPMDDNLHGTHVAGILAAVGNDENGIAGVAWSAGVMALKAFDESGAGSLDDTITALAYAEEQGARVINASWGTTTRSRALDEVVAEAVRRGVVVVAAAGNNASEVAFFPAAVPEVIAVGSTDAKDGSSSFSNFGSFVDVVAPGDGIHSTAPNATWTVLNGTSMAAPHVSGLVVLQLSLRPQFTPAEIRTILQSTAQEVRTDRFTGSGRIHAGRAVRVTEPLPTAWLTLPPVLSGKVDLMGEVGGNGFAGFRVEIGLGTLPEAWTEIVSGAEPVAGGVLVTGFDSSAFDDGDYSIRVLATNRLGQAAVHRGLAALRNVRLASPANNDIWRGDVPLEFRGTVFGAGRTFSLMWGLGQQPTQWSDLGITLTGGGTSPVVDDVLGRWDPAVAGTHDFVTFRLESRRDGRLVGEAFARLVHKESRLRQGWPRYYPFQEDFAEANWREFNVADLEGTGGQEVILVDHGEPGEGRPPRLKVLGAAGEERWAVDLPSGAPEFDAPVVGDLDGDGRMEVLVDTGSGGQIQAFDAAGKPLGGGWPVTPGGTHFGKILADVNADGRLELVALSDPPADLVGAPQRRLFVIDAGGRVLADWSFSACAESPETPMPELLPAVVNLDDDPELELVALDGCSGISAFDLAKTGGPVWTANLDARLVASPVTGDLDGDGREEVVLGGVSRGSGLPGGVHILGADGKARPGWPVLLEESFHGSVALADLDADDRLEIVAASWETRTVHVLKPDGFELNGWPLPAQTKAGTRSIPVIGDVDGDGQPDVVLASPGFWLLVMVGGDTSLAGGVRAWRADGTAIDFHPAAPMDSLLTESVGGSVWNRLPPAALVDLDGDGRLDIVAGTIQDRAFAPTLPRSVPKMRSSLYAWELDVPYRRETMPWPMVQGGPQRTGRYERPPKPNRPPVIQNIPDQTVAAGSGFRTFGLDRYVIDPDGGRNRLVWSVQGARELSVVVDDRRFVTVEMPSPAWEGSEAVEFVVRDPEGGDDRETVVFSARAGYQPPLAEPDEIQTEEDVAVELDPRMNDRSPTGRALRLTAVSAPGFGTTLLQADGKVRYEPAEDFFGADAFEYTVQDDDGGMAVGEVRVRVVGMPDSPVTEADRLILEEDTVGEVDLLENDRDPDGEVVELVDVQEPEQGRWEQLGASRLRFVPPPDWFGVQKLVYRVKDPTGLVATGEVAVLVRAVNDPPVLRDQEIRLNRNRAADVFYDARDVDGDSLRFTIVDGPTNGVLLAYPTMANYEPRRGLSGEDRFTYTATDGWVTSPPATVTLTVGDANNAPDVESMETVTSVDQELPLALRVRDADGDAVTIRVVAMPEHGAVSLDGTNGVYRPSLGFLGEDRFTFRAGDGAAESVEGEVRIRVTDDNTPPVARSEVLTVARNAATAVRLVATDGENNPLRFLVVTNPVFGVLEGTPPELHYRPRPNFRGLDRLHFQASDRMSTSEVAVVHLLVRDPNQAPVVTNQVVDVVKDRVTPIGLAAADGDGHELRVAVLKGPRFGRLYGTGTRMLYQPRSGFEGQDSFTYKVWDGMAYSGVGSVTVNVARGGSGVSSRIAKVRVLEEGVELLLEGEVGKTLSIEGSRDLVTWETLARVPLDAEVVRWLDVSSERGSVRFYRVLDPVF